MKFKTENIDALMLTTLRSNWQETMNMKQTSHRFAPIVTDMKQKKMNWNLKPLDQIVLLVTHYNLPSTGTAAPLSE